MSTYGQGRDQECFGKLDPAINDFVSRYNANPSRDHTTIFLFPGGLGSHLLRAHTQYQNGPPFFYNTAWLDCSIALGTAIDLQMQGDEDHQQRYVVPDGCVDFVSLRPYAGFIHWCKCNSLDLFVFGWDWRRGIQKTADFFLGTFLPAFETRVSRCSPDPLDNFTLIGHSFGGMVVKAILNQSSNDYVKKMRRAITVATPFYGYGGQVHRFFKGDPALNWTEGLGGAAVITDIVSTLAAGYELLFLDEATYNANKVALASDPEGYNLTCYPSMDATTAGERADPYNPKPGAPVPGATGDVRYISNHGFDWQLLAAGKVAYAKVPEPLDRSVAAKFYNIRGVQFKNGKVVKGTVVSQTWKRVPPTFDPDNDPDPLADNLGPGDGTLPAWSTRLLGKPENVVTIKGDIEHMIMMNQAPVQAEIAKLLQPGTKALRRMRARAKTMKTKAASTAKLNRFLGGLRAITVKRELSAAQRNDAVREYLRGYSAEELQEFLGRAYLDALKSPSQKAGPPADRDRDRATKKASRQTKRRRK